MSVSDSRPYAVSDELTPDARPRIVIENSQAAAIAHVVRGRFGARALNTMELLSLTSQGVKPEDPRGVLAPPPKPASDPVVDSADGAMQAIGHAIGHASNPADTSPAAQEPAP